MYPATRLETSAISSGVNCGDSLALSLAHTVAVVTSGALVDGATTVGIVLRYMRSNVHVPQLADKVVNVIALVGSQRDVAIAGNVLDHEQSGIAFGCAIGLRSARGHNQSVAVLGEQMAAIGQHRRAATALASLHGIRVGCGEVGIIAALFAVEVYRWIRAALFARSRRWLLVIINTAKTLLPRPCFQQGSIHGEVLIREQVAPSRLFQNGLKERFGNVASQ